MQKIMIDKDEQDSAMDFGNDEIEFGDDINKNL